MQSTSLLCSSNTFSLCKSQRLTFISRKLHVDYGDVFSFPSKLSLTCLRTCRPAIHTLHSTAMQEVVETRPSGSELVEIGYIYGVHGLQGEVWVKHNSDFPDLRFSKPGKRWLRQQVAGSETLKEIELAVGRGHPGQGSWIVKFREVDTVEEALKLVGSTILVTDEDRPVLEEGEFYTRDLIGMKVILKETGEPVGTVVNVFNSGASDLLHVKLNLSAVRPGQSGSKLEATSSAPLVWIPFVEAIVPNVDLDKQEMLITPPKGLLELNIRSDERSKKERRQLEWKERKKFQKRLIAAKKKLCEMEQQHIFHGYGYGGKGQASLLSDQIVSVNSQLLQQAMQAINISTTRRSVLEILGAVPTKNTLLFDEAVFAGRDGHSNLYTKLKSKGQLLTSHGKVAISIVLEDWSSDHSLLHSQRNEDTCQLVKAFLEDEMKLKTEDRWSVPLIFVCPAETVASLQELFSDNDHFAFDSEKIWFLEEEKLPVVSNLVESQEQPKILMKSPWEILQTAVGSGGLISLFSSNNLVDHLSGMGVQYIEVCNMNQNFKHGEALLGLLDSCNADLGIQLFDKEDTFDKHFNTIFSTSLMKRLTKNINKLHFHAVPSLHSHVELVDKNWIDVVPSTPNSYEFHCSIYNCLDACPPNKVCVLDATE